LRVKRHLAPLLLLVAGCVGFDQPTSARLEGLPLDREDRASSPRSQTYARCRFRMSVDSPWLAGEFDGIVVAHRFMLNPVLRVQLFGDLGPKMVDLVARPDRIVGYFPQTREGIDCDLPREATPHLLLFLGASLTEEFLGWGDRSRVTGVRAEGDGAWLRLRPTIPGTAPLLYVERGSTAKKRHVSWMTGVSWDEVWPTPEECRITAPNLSIRVRILERSLEPPATLESMKLTLPDDVRIVKGSRK
jgi:hypothetical protein